MTAAQKNKLFYFKQEVYLNNKTEGKTIQDQTFVLESFTPT